MLKSTVLLLSSILIAIDQVLKHWVLENLLGKRSIEIIPGIFRLTYVENYGAAFGIFQGKTLMLTIIVLAVLLVIIYTILSGKVREQIILFSFSLIIAGGVGNLIDRIRLGFVVDYLDFSALFSFPVFNFADCCVVSGTVIMLIYVIVSDYIEQKKDGMAIVAKDGADGNISGGKS